MDVIRLNFTCKSFRSNLILITDFKYLQLNLILYIYQKIFFQIYQIWKKLEKKPQLIF